MSLQTEFNFTLPVGYVDNNGTLHKDGIMRRATAADEIFPLKEPHVQNNPAYSCNILLSRVVTKLGNLPKVTPGVIESLAASDLTFLKALQKKINRHGKTGPR
jgi:hypothetical protein